MFPLFTNAALLAGLAGVAAPVLIHLLVRRKSQRLKFSTIQFFVKRDEQSMRKRKLRNLLLLSARVLLFALIALAFARPYLPGGQTAAVATRRQQVILLLDTSASMQASGPAGQQWQRAKEMARQVLATLKADDRAALVTSGAQVATAAAFAPASVIAQKLAELTPTLGSGELTAGLNQAIKTLATGQLGYTTTLHLFSDLQKAASQNLAGTPLPDDLPVKLHDLGERYIPNTAVTELQLETRENSGPHAVVTSFSDENYSGLAATFKIDGKAVSAPSLNLRAGSVTNVPLILPTLPPGWHTVEFSTPAKDTLAADNIRYATWLVPQPIHGLVVETRPSKKAFQEETFFVRAALNPASGSNQASASRFTFEKIDADSLSTRLQPQPGRPKAEFVMLPGLKQIPAATVAALTTYVKGGGGLLLFLGEGVSANKYNSDLRDLLPASLDKLEITGEKDASWRIAEYQKSSPLFTVFREPNSGNLFLPEFTHRFKLAATPDSAVVAQFDDGIPAIIERKVGQGRVVLANTSADTSWTDWPKHKTFVPWLHAAGHFISARDAARESVEQPGYESGSEVDLDTGLKKQPLKLTRPDATEIALVTDDHGRLKDVLLATPGIYSIKTSEGQELRRFAVNFPTAESELAFLPSADFQQQLARKAAPPNPTLLAGVFGDSNQGKELWRVLLLSALVLMLVEPLIANRTLA